MKALATRQVQERLNDGSNMNLKYDGTTDRLGRHVTEIEVATEKEMLLVGMRHQVGGSGTEHSETITDVLNEVDTREEGSEPATKYFKHNDRLSRCKAEGGHSTNSDALCTPLTPYRRNATESLVKQNHLTSQTNNYGHVPYQHRDESLTQATIRCVSKLSNDLSVGCTADRWETNSTFYLRVLFCCINTNHI